MINLRLVARKHPTLIIFKIPVSLSFSLQNYRVNSLLQVSFGWRQRTGFCESVLSEASDLAAAAEREEVRPVAEKVETAGWSAGHTSLGRGKEGHTLPHEVGSFWDRPHQTKEGQRGHNCRNRDRYGDTFATHTDGARKGPPREPI